MGAFHGSISARISQDRFVINKREVIFDNICESDLIVLDKTHDYRWNDASSDAHIHANIYASFSEAKFICYASSPYITAFSLKNANLKPQDYFGYEMLGEEIDIFDPKDFESWYERADTDIVRNLKATKRNFIIIRGYGVYVFGRDIGHLNKIVALIDHSVKVLTLAEGLYLNTKDSTHFEV
ncbi:MAG: class II aldolase/adducin family protein [Helicobacter sp.]|nr:class II aldolase/adducin family protein [Helicobacter sp.]MCI7485731.1 class II aldolase/adducin family protein [Helicobacter sp.]